MAAMFLANVTDNYIDKLCRCIDLVFGFNPSSTPTPLPSQSFSTALEFDWGGSGSRGIWDLSGVHAIQG